MYIISLILSSALFLIVGYIFGVGLTKSYLEKKYKTDRKEFNRYLKIND